ncbi:MAG: vitamin K epoxide reductase family protein [Nitrospirales bacterium]|nr:vitamin K epoxide reductase family protein [Nitrospira sp.]MDR4501145.1 vitamin K epoxide reductase family protein [Nitrospirales bacterium]
MSKRHKRQRSEPASNVHGTSTSNEPHGIPPLTLALLILAVAGILLTSYLTYVAWFEDHPAFCSEGSACDLVQSSRWSTFLMVPMAFWGLLTYIIMANLIWNSRHRPCISKPFLFVAICGFAISAYLTIVSIVEIEATCPYCLASFFILTSMVILAIIQRPAGWLTSVKEASVIALIIVGILHLHYSGTFDAAAGPEDPQLQALATHLTKTGARFYGAYWCPRCQEQKAIFQASAKRLPYVECSSGGRGSPLTKPCAAEKIKSYPTWIINDTRYTGLQTPSSLAVNSGFAWKD